MRLFSALRRQILRRADPVEALDVTAGLLIDKLKLAGRNLGSRS